MALKIELENINNFLFLGNIKELILQLIDSHNIVLNKLKCYR